MIKGLSGTIDVGDVDFARVMESKNAVFLSYASEDAEVALKICMTLSADGIEVRFDQSANCRVATRGYKSH